VVIHIVMRLSSSLFLDYSIDLLIKYLSITATDITSKQKCITVNVVLSVIYCVAVICLCVACEVSSQ